MAKSGITIWPGDEGSSDGVGEMVGRIAEYLAPYVPLLQNKEQGEHLHHMVTGLLSDLERKSAEPIAILLGLPRRLLQNFLGLSRWAWEPLRRRQRLEVREQIGVEDATLIIDPSAVPKKGSETVGVARQWCGRLGKIDNCVVGVHAAYVGLDGQSALVESQLFLPDEWANDAARRDKVHVPTDVAGQTKIEIGMDMVRRMAAELPFQWVLADEEYGRSTAFRDGVTALGKWSLFEVPKDTLVQTMSGTGSRLPQRADYLVSMMRKQRRLTTVRVAYGEKQPIMVEALMVPVVTKRTTGARVREMLLYTRDAAGDHHFFLGQLPKGTGLTEAVRRAHRRHRIEEVFEEAKGEVGMDHFECRAWHGWHHHMTLVQIAHWCMVREQRRMGKKMSWNHRRHAPAGLRQALGQRVVHRPHRRTNGLPAHAQ